MRMRIYSVFFHCMNQSIKMHLELSHYSRYGAENVYIYIISYSYYHTKSDVFSPKVSIITNVILILYSSSINKQLI